MYGSFDVIYLYFLHVLSSEEELSRGNISKCKYNDYISMDRQQFPFFINIFQCQNLFDTKNPGGWSGGAKVSCTSRHRGVQLILAYSWARPAILVAGKGRRRCFYFLCFFTFTPVPHFSMSSLSSLLLFLSLFSLSLGDDTK